MKHKIIIIIAAAFAIAIVSLLVVGHFFNDTISKSQNEYDASESRNNGPSNTPQNVAFTSPMFDPALVSHITPLGELNGGYEEYQAVAGVMINIKPDAVSNGKQIEVRAPTDMTLESYAYYKSPNDGQTEWALIFRISPEIVIKFDHISNAVQEIIDATTNTPKDTSATHNPQRKISFKAGDLIGRTHGTKLAHNWNIYMTDESVENSFINKERYKDRDSGRRMLSARCPFDFYSEDMRMQFMNLMGYSKAGESNSCGNPSRDVPGTVSGMWHFSPNNVLSEDMDGVYASPLYVIKNSAGQITIDQVGNGRLDINQADPANKDPAHITNEHCYQLHTSYAYFKILSSQEMQFAYGSGSCPSTFPADMAKTYYR